MLSDVEIARSVSPRAIDTIAHSLNLGEDEYLPYGRDKAKLSLSILDRPRSRPTPPKLVLVSAITPTSAGEGKTTTTIGLGQGLAQLGESVCLALREPSLGPCMGMKGGATGGGYSQVIPAESINLHFTGDFHAITAAHNLLAAIMDNHLHHGNELNIDPQRILWRRVLDMNDRSLRNTIVGLGGVNQGIPREAGFDITASSEVMAMLCLAENQDDLRERLNRTLVAFSRDGKPITAGELNITGAMLALLKDALMPNLVQTLEGTPVVIHGGPFANIAHGCNSILATRMAMHLADWTVTEAGFGFDLGAEKFFDIKCVGADLDVAAVVLVATVRALKMHAGVKRRDLSTPDPAAVARGIPNLEKHIDNIGHFNKPAVIAINRFGTDTDDEVNVIVEHCKQLGVSVTICDHFARGGEGALDLARKVVEIGKQAATKMTPLYQWSDPIEDKVLAVAQRMYGARTVNLTKKAKKDLRDIRRLGYEKLPICIAKTQSSLSDNPRLKGRPTDFNVTVRRLYVSAGAGFIVVMTGDILRMPGLPKIPQAEHMDVEDDVVIGMA
jgi:formate--tetrahydrofolate ligase